MTREEFKEFEEQGIEARANQLSKESNPYIKESEQHYAWNAGWEFEDYLTDLFGSAYEDGE